MEKIMFNTVNRHLIIGGVGILLLLSLVLSVSTVNADTYDTVINNGRIIDPETGFDKVANIGINDGTIVTITEQPIKGKKIIDATGLVVSPGFIDTHAHGQNIGAYRNYAMQGVTTALELESGILPIGKWYDIQEGKGLPIHFGAAAGWTFARIATFEGTEPEPTAAYFQAAQGHNEWKEDIASDKRLQKILGLVEQGLNEGGLGIGINGGYAPGYGEKEYYALSKLAAQRGVAAYTHVRYMSMLEPQGTFEAIKELIANSVLTGAKMHICHINSSSIRDIDATLELIERAQAKGIDISAAAYPWAAASTVVRAGMFTGPNWKQRTGYTPGSFQLGKNRLTDEQVDEYQIKAPGTFITWHFLDENKPEELAILDKSITHPNVMIESDAMPWMHKDGSPYEGDDWPLNPDLIAHPRSSGSFAKILGSYVRERKLLTLNEAIRKMSLMPAQLLEDFVPQMKKKGRLQEGMDADIVIFNLKTITNRATYENPTIAASGVQTLLVSGQLVIEKGVLIKEAAPGKAIRRELRSVN